MGWPNTFPGEMAGISDFSNSRRDGRMQQNGFYLPRFLEKREKSLSGIPRFGQSIFGEKPNKDGFYHLRRHIGNESEDILEQQDRLIGSPCAT
jgi:hypothetical protein